MAAASGPVALSTLACPECRGALVSESESIVRCERCGVKATRLAWGSISFLWSGDAERRAAELTSWEEHLDREAEGVAARLEGFVWPMVTSWSTRRRPEGTRPRIVDVGCGTGDSVEWLLARGADAWGVDPDQFRQLSWRRRLKPERLVGASGLALPFADGSFDVLISSGVIEHVGVAESGSPYRVAPLPDRDEQRGRFISECLRVLAPDGLALLDFPNGSFPIDFWHGNAAGAARFHRRDEGFLPTFAEVSSLVARSGFAAIVRALSPHGRLRCRQVSSHWYGRLARPAALAWFWLLARPPFDRLVPTPLCPYLCVAIQRETTA